MIRRFVLCAAIVQALIVPASAHRLDEYLQATTIDVVKDLNAPVLGLYGGADAGIPNDTVEKMRAALKAAGKPSEFHLYPDMPHGFHADYRPSYRKEAAQDGWKRLLDWFKKHGVS